MGWICISCGHEFYIDIANKDKCPKCGSTNLEAFDELDSDSDFSDEPQAFDDLCMDWEY